MDCAERGQVGEGGGGGGVGWVVRFGGWPPQGLIGKGCKGEMKFARGAGPAKGRCTVGM